MFAGGENEMARQSNGVLEAWFKKRRSTPRVLWGPERAYLHLGPRLGPEAGYVEADWSFGALDKITCRRGGPYVFKAELLGVNKVPHRSIVDLEAALAKFSHQTAQGELSVPDPLREKDMVLAGNGFGFVAAHLAWRHAARLLEPPNPIDHRAGSDAKSGRHPMPR
jgi:hypothetical protein